MLLSGRSLRGVTGGRGLSSRSLRGVTAGGGQHDWQFFSVHTKAEYGLSKSFFEFFLKELILGSRFKFVGREFHRFGPIYLRDR